MTRTRGTTGQEATERHGRRLLALACGVALAVVPAGAAQARLGDLDPSFDGDGIANPNVSGVLEAIAARPTGEPVAVGTAPGEAVVVQLTNAGEVSGVTRFPNANLVLRFHGVALDSAGRVLAAGDQASATAPAQTTPIVHRLNESGAPGTTFPIPGTIGQAHAVVPLDAGMLVAGWRGGPAQHDVFFVARLDANGRPDASFGGLADFGVPARATAMTVDTAGRVVLAGQAGSELALARFNSDGTPDNTFDGDGKLTFGQGALNAVQVDGLGRITAAGGSNRSPIVVRRLVNGDPDFATLGTQDGSELHGLALDGARSLVAGRNGASQLLLGSLDGAGAPEPALAWRSFPGAGAAFGAALGPGGTVYTAGGPAAFISRHLPNSAPTAALASPDQVLVGEPATFDAGGSTDPEGEQLRFAFDLDGNGSYEFDGGANPLALRSFPAPGTYTVGVQVTDPRGASATAARGITVVAAPTPTPLPQPILGRQGVAKPLRGIVRYRLPGTKTFLRLTELTAIPNGTEIDARKGRLLLTVLHDASGRLDGAEFYAGRFIFRQGKGATPKTTLKLTGGSFKNCTRDVAEGEPRGTSGLAWQAKPRSVLAMASSVADGTGTRTKRRVRKLWGDGRGRFRTRGRYGAATVRGTKWLTLDRCDGTKVRVVRGKVSVQDLVRPNRRPQLVKAGGKAFVPYKR